MTYSSSSHPIEDDHETRLGIAEKEPSGRDAVPHENDTGPGENDNAPWIRARFYAETD